MTLNWPQIERGLTQGTYNLLLGAGVSIDSISQSNIEKYKGPLPTAGTFRDDLASLKPGIRVGASINRLYRSLNTNEIEEHVTKRFANPIAGATVKQITEFRWKRIFTLNVDNALEIGYENNKQRAQKPQVINFPDPYQATQDPGVIPIIHLHGIVTRPNDNYIFDIKRYMQSIQDNNLWLHVLSSVIPAEPFIVIGTSLEEPDITYFMDERTETSVRSDRPQSLLVEPFPDDGTKQDCDEFRLELHEATGLDFLQDLAKRFPHRPSLSIVVRGGPHSLDSLTARLRWMLFASMPPVSPSPIA